MAEDLTNNEVEESTDEGEVVVPVPNEEAVAYRDGIVAVLEEEIPIVVDSMVVYINALIKSRSTESDPVVTISAELLGRASSKGSIYPTHDKAIIIEQTAKLFDGAGYDVTLVPTEGTQTVPTYILKLKR